MRIFARIKIYIFLIGFISTKKVLAQDTFIYPAAFKGLGKEFQLLEIISNKLGEK